MWNLTFTVFKTFFFQSLFQKWGCQKIASKIFKKNKFSKELFSYLMFKIRVSLYYSLFIHLQANNRRKYNSIHIIMYNLYSRKLLVL